MFLLRAALAIYECWRQRLCRCWGFSYAAAFSLSDLCILRLKHEFNRLDEVLDPNRAQCARDQMIQNDCELR
jgi:hypothetical protein